jgi:hypothetical protein
MSEGDVGLRRWILGSVAMLVLTVCASVAAGTSEAGRRMVVTQTPLVGTSQSSESRAPVAPDCPSPSADEYFANFVNGMAAVSQSNVWAVGSTSSNRALIERWNGQAWKRAPSPSPDGGHHCSVLSAVATIGSRDAWTVGFYGKGNRVKTLIERWNGRRWRQVPSPSPGGPHAASILTGVAATGPSSAWAVGFIVHVNGNARKHITAETLIEHWNGRAWKRVRSPSPHVGSFSDDQLTGVAASAPSDAWAVGNSYGLGGRSYTLIMHWNGHAWTRVPSPSPGEGPLLNAVASAPSGRAWAVGLWNMPHRPERPLIEHWNGRRWRQEPSPQPPRSGESNLLAVTATSPSNAWTVGYYVAGPDAFQLQSKTLVEHWNGRAWKRVPSPSPGDPGYAQTALRAVSAPSSSTAWASGTYRTTNHDHDLVTHILTERWNGTQWAAVRCSCPTAVQPPSY